MTASDGGWLVTTDIDRFIGGIEMRYHEACKKARKAANAAKENRYVIWDEDILGYAVCDDYELDNWYAREPFRAVAVPGEDIFEIR